MTTQYSDNLVFSGHSFYLMVKFSSKWSIGIISTPDGHGVSQ